MSEFEETPEYQAQVERVANLPRHHITIEHRDGIKWECYTSELNWAALQRAYEGLPSMVRG